MTSWQRGTQQAAQAGASGLNSSWEGQENEPATAMVVRGKHLRPRKQSTQVHTGRFPRSTAYKRRQAHAQLAREACRGRIRQCSAMPECVRYRPVIQEAIRPPGSSLDTVCHPSGLLGGHSPLQTSSGRCMDARFRHKSLPKSSETDHAIQW